MSRMPAALIAGSFVVCISALAAHMASAEPGRPSPESSSAAEQVSAPDEPVREPARQVPVEPYGDAVPADAVTGATDDSRSGADTSPAADKHTPETVHKPEPAEAVNDDPVPETVEGSGQPSGVDAEKAHGADQPETAVKAPARQVPLIGEEMPPGDRDTSSAGTGGAGLETPSAAKSDGPVARQIPAGEEEPADPPAKQTRTVTPVTEPEPAPAGQARGNKPVEEAPPHMSAPGLPVRKPPVPVARTAREKVGGRDMRQEKKPPPQEKKARGSREDQLCKALKACRHQFIRCKGRITHPDQSEAWSVAKEECGAEYNACVEKDFRPGEWFFTRWFHFWELECG